MAFYNLPRVHGAGAACGTTLELKIEFTPRGAQVSGITPPGPRHHEGRSRDRHATWCGLRWTKRQGDALALSACKSNWPSHFQVADVAGAIAGRIGPI
jgi:hypothetical protein